jgi:cell division protease FtsH
LLEAQNTDLRSLPDVGETEGRWIFAFLPWLLMLAFFFWFQNRMRGNAIGRYGGGDVTDFLKGSSAKEEKAGTKITFDDVAGQDNAKREVAELVDFLREPERYRRLGAEPPRGVLLMGPPGTGKTLLARALAGEAGVPFFHISASEFIEMFVGVGASRVRRMFDEAKKRAPCIIFIDELDSVGRMRGAGYGGGHDEREQTLNQILAELDGFSGHEAVVVLAATNRPDVLDPALLRPGRFDRHVTLELPDKAAREAVLKVHTRKVPLAKDVDLGEIAAGTPGFSGADLKNLVNEAAMAAAREEVGQVTMRHLDEMRDKVMMGSAGHTAVAHYLSYADPLYKVTIIPRGRTLGGTHMLPDKERHTLPEPYLKDQLAVILGGRTAERELLGSASSGADDDIQRATQMARAMVARWGMSDAIGPVDLRQSEEHPFLGREIAQPRRFSETTAHEVDKAVAELLQGAEERASETIRQNKPRIEKLITALEAKETLNRDEIASYLGPNRSHIGSLTMLTPRA